MTDRSGVVEAIEFLARSTNRVQLLETLRDRDQATRDDLRSAVSASRTTVSRNLDALVERGWIQQGDGTYALAPGVEDVLDDFLELEETVGALDHLQPFLEWTDRDAFDVDLSLLRDATVVVPEPGNPWAMVNAHVNRVRESTDDRVAIPVIGLHAYEAVHEKFVNGDARGEIVVSEHVAETMTTDPDYVPLTRELLEVEALELYRTTDDVPFYLGVLDDVVQVGVDEAGEPRALLETSNDAVREWAHERLGALRSRAEPVTVDEIRESRDE
ncbi:winged helix-turn-helix domain-containing protein [Halorubellus sp. JP-L1]|uniref:helix-turn-helix transcriptional regulator n=1 Tax=Halorubellus sp. JP-L1 TaxID=2715753 RepID=UPI00140C9044|nr:winged helix-turn-helix domain-containing protein [Halorubellus sp. JP-L1]NHN43250.1 winged helix-turn-helix domain-containing protein [Halorubellus sp. JP-L1]